MHQFWELEYLGISDLDSKREDKLVYNEFQPVVQRDESGRYIIVGHGAMKKVAFILDYSYVS